MIEPYICSSDYYEWSLCFSMYPEYYEIIEKPMDFATLKKCINDFVTLDEALVSLRLIWRNCLEFNAEGSEIADSAISIGNDGEKLIEVRFVKEIT
jgi:hypothetical protein